MMSKVDAISRWDGHKISSVHRHVKHRRPQSKKSQVETDHYEGSNQSAPSWVSQKRKLFHRNLLNEIRAVRNKPAITPILRAPWPDPEALSLEKELIKRPTFENYFHVIEDFRSSLLAVGHQKFVYLTDVVIEPTLDLSTVDDQYASASAKKLERWHQKTQKQFLAQEKKALKKAEHRHELIKRKGRGLGGAMAEGLNKGKAIAFYSKNNLTIRGNVFRMTHVLHPKNLYEIMPRYGYRKGLHIGVRISQFGINGILAAIGYALFPITFGISKVITDHARTVITLTGESITHKIAGAPMGKITTHAGLRGLQLEIPRTIPILGSIINFGESAALGAAAFGIVSTTIADAILQSFSDRYVSKINVDDLGDSRCLMEMDRRIDYLSRFLLPYGQYLLLKEGEIKKRKRLKKVLKVEFKRLRNLEKKRSRAFNFYRLALAAERIPDSYRQKISMDCKRASKNNCINTHRVARRALMTLLNKDAQSSHQGGLKLI